jgi:hypothetical protein
MEIPLIIAILYVLTIYLCCKALFSYNRKIERLNEEKEIKNTFKPKL